MGHAGGVVTPSGGCHVSTSAVDFGTTSNDNMALVVYSASTSPYLQHSPTSSEVVHSGVEDAMPRFNPPAAGRKGKAVVVKREKVSPPPKARHHDKGKAPVASTSRRGPSRSGSTRNDVLELAVARPSTTKSSARGGSKVRETPRGRKGKDKEEDEEDKEKEEEEEHGSEEEDADESSHATEHEEDEEEEEDSLHTVELDEEDEKELERMKAEEASKKRRKKEVQETRTKHKHDRSKETTSEARKFRPFSSAF